MLDNTRWEASNDRGEQQPAALCSSILAFSLALALRFADDAELAGLAPQPLVGAGVTIVARGTCANLSLEMTMTDIRNPIAHDGIANCSANDVAGMVNNIRIAVIILHALHARQGGALFTRTGLKAAHVNASDLHAVFAPLVAAFLLGSALVAGSLSMPSSP